MSRSAQSQLSCWRLTPYCRSSLDAALADLELFGQLQSACSGQVAMDQPRNVLVRQPAPHPPDARSPTADAAVVRLLLSVVAFNYIPTGFLKPFPHVNAVRVTSDKLHKSCSYLNSDTSKTPSNGGRYCSWQSRPPVTPTPSPTAPLH